MKYEKPEVTVSGRTVETIQSHVKKGNFTPVDLSIELTTNTAYEADE